MARIQTPTTPRTHLRITLPPSPPHLPPPPQPHLQPSPWRGRRLPVPRRPHTNRDSHSSPWTRRQVRRSRWGKLLGVINSPFLVMSCFTSRYTYWPSIISSYLPFSLSFSPILERVQIFFFPNPSLRHQGSPQPASPLSPPVMPFLHCPPCHAIYSSQTITFPYSPRCHDLLAVCPHHALTRPPFPFVSPVHSPPNTIRFLSHSPLFLLFPVEHFASCLITLLPTSSSPLSLPTYLYSIFSHSLTQHYPTSLPTIHLPCCFPST